MKKIILICIPCILTILLVINAYTYLSYKNKFTLIIEKTNNYNEQMKEQNNKITNLSNELTKIKEINKDKISHYERWIKWNKEIIELTK